MSQQHAIDTDKELGEMTDEELIELCKAVERIGGKSAPHAREIRQSLEADSAGFDGGAE